jgi:hypothetical protein
MARLRPFSIALGVVVVLLARPAVPTARQTAVPAPQDVLGFAPGDDYKLADYGQIKSYFEKLDAASDRVTVTSAGKSTEGREMLVAVISSEANLRELARYKDIAHRLARVRGLSEADARALAAEGKAIVWIDNGLHASEVASAQHAMTLAWRVATDESPEMRAVRENVILVLLPTINPDGLDKVVDWYRRTLNTPNQDSPMPWLYQKYIGHDNNRDFYMQTQAETRVLSRLLYEEWLPEILYNQHQGTWPPRIFVPPFPDPFNPNIDPLIMRSIDLVGGAMLRRFESEGKDGVISRHEFSTWYNGSIRTTAYFHNILGILTETGHASATPFTYDPADFPRELDDGISTVEPSTNYPSPWKGGTLHLKDAVDYMLTGSLAVLDVASKYREAFLYGIYQVGARQIEKGKTEAPVAYVIPPQQHDLPAAALFVETLMRGGVEIHRADAPFTADGKVYDAGSWVVRLDQPFRPFAKDLLEPQRYPDIRTSPGGPPEPPYDIAGWTLAYQMGVQAIAIQRPFDATLTTLEAYPTITGRIRTGPDSVQDERSARANAIAAPGLYFLDPSANQVFAAVNELLAAGLPVSRATSRPADSAPGWTRGAFAVSARTPAQAELLTTTVRRRGLTADLVARPKAIALPAIRPARVALYRSWIANIDEGWTRWVLEQFGFQYATVTNADIQVGHLADRFDVVILPSQSPSAILDGHRPDAARPRAGPWNPVPAEYQGGIGDAGLAALKAFVDAGGTLVAFDQASDLVINRFGDVFTHVHDVVQGLDQKTFYCPGSVLKIVVDPNAPAAFGMAPEAAAFFAGSRGFETDDPSVVSVARYAPAGELLMSGWLLGADKLAGRHALVEVPYGKGRVLLFGFRPQFRAQPHGTFKLLFNALYRKSMGP